MSKNYNKDKTVKEKEKENNIKNLTNNNIISYNFYFERNIPEQTNNCKENKNKEITKNNHQEKSSGINKNIFKKKDIICPKCGEKAFINIKDYKITLYNCQYNHKIQNILLSEFKDSQKKGLSKIKCDNCLIMDRNNTEQNEFYRCLKCQINLCPKCKNNHDNIKHIIVKYELLCNICTKHNSFYKNYCNKCEKSLCSYFHCEHIGHEIKNFKDLYESKNYIKYEIEEMKSKIEQFNKIKNEIQKVLDSTESYLDLYYNINYNMFSNYTKSILNYEVFSNLNKISEKFKMPDIENLISEKDISKQFILILDIYNKMINKENKIDSQSNNRHGNAYNKYKKSEKITIDSKQNIKFTPNDSQINPQLQKIQSKTDKDTYKNYNDEKKMQSKTDLSDALKKKNDSLRARTLKLNENFNNKENNNKNSNLISNDLTNEEKNNKMNIYNYNVNNNNNNLISQIPHSNKGNLRNETHDNHNIKNKNESNNIIVMKNNIEKKITKEVCELKSEAQKEKKEKEKEIKKFVSIDKYGKKENILKNRLAEKMKIEIKEKKLQYISYSYNKPKGLYNLGLSCYMNSLLQCLYYIKELREYFIEKRNTFTNQQPVCKALAEVMYGLKNEKKDYFEATEFKKIMGSKNSLFKGFKAGDAKDLFINLIDSLLTELTVEKEDDNELEENVDLTKKLDVFKITKDEVYDNIINNLFIGFYETIYNCKNNKKMKTYAFSTESFISFNLEKITQYYKNKTLRIEDCFKYNYNRSYKTSFFCDKCKVTEENITNDKIFVPPKIFVLVLDRGHGKTFRGKVSFKTDLDLEGLIDKEENKNTFNTKYRLIGVSTHSGRSSSSGHYTACCLTDDEKYYYFSDTYVNEAKENEIYENEPYLLFYKRLDSFPSPN